MTNTFKVLAIADIHMSNRLPMAKPSENDRTDRLDDQLELWKHVKTVADDENVDAIMVLGDLFDRSLIDAVTLTHTVQAIVDLNRETYILPGNHDANSIRGGRFTVEAFGAMRHKHIQVIGEKAGQSLVVGAGKDSWAFWPVAFKPAEAMMDEIVVIRTSMKETARHNVLLLHASILGAYHMEWECDDGLDPDKVCKGFDAVYAGHFHAQQQFGRCGHYLGAPMHHHFGDVNRSSGFWLLEFGPGGSRYEKYISSRTPRFHLLKGLEDSAKTKKGDYVRYEVEVTHAEWAKLKPEIQVRNERMNAAGRKTDFIHKPVYHHKSRLAKPGKAGVGISMESAVVDYIKASGVETSGLNGKRLKKLGLEVLAEARSAYGFD